MAATARSPRTEVLAALGPLLAAIAVAEVLGHAPPQLRTPGVLLYPFALYAGYRGGLRVALAAGLLASAYVSTFSLRFGPSTLLEEPGTGTLVFLVGVPLTALLLGHLRDASTRALQAERAARDAAERARHELREILESITDGFMAVDAAGRITYVNAAAEAMLGKLRGELLGQEARRAFPVGRFAPFYSGVARAREAGESLRFEARVPGTDQWLEVQAYTSHSGLTVYFRDATERRTADERLRSLSLLDELTGLYNRRGFLRVAEQQLKLALRRRAAITLIFADLDGLKLINDQLGHAAGDRAIRAAAAILRDSFRESDIVGRIGGDEFVGLAFETGEDAAPLLEARLREAVERARHQDEHPFPLSLSVGSATFDPACPCTIEELLSRADHAMYQAKRARRAARERHGQLPPS